MPEKAQVIRRRIASVSNTAKITRTMEMVATSKLLRAQSKVVGAGPYMETLREIMSRLALMDLDTSAYPLFEERFDRQPDGPARVRRRPAHGGRTPRTVPVG